MNKEDRTNLKVLFLSLASIVVLTTLVTTLANYTSHESTKIRQGKEVFESYDKNFARAFDELDKDRKKYEDAWYFWKGKENKAKKRMKELKTEESVKRYKEIKDKADAMDAKRDEVLSKIWALEAYFDEYYEIE